jgi:hypothetical protein
MRTGRFTEQQIVGIRKEHVAGAKTAPAKLAILPLQGLEALLLLHGQAGPLARIPLRLLHPVPKGLSRTAQFLGN